jgi:hypothetical protein
MNGEVTASRSMRSEEPAEYAAPESIPVSVSRKTT